MTAAERAVAGVVTLLLWPAYLVAALVDVCNAPRRHRFELELAADTERWSRRHPQGAS